MTPEEETTAQYRFLAINVIRIAGAILLVFGLAIIAKGVFDLPNAVGYVLFVAGMIGFMLVPRLLAKRWKSSKDV